MLFRSGAATAHQYVFVGVLILSGLLNAFYFFRLLENVYLREPDYSKWEIKKVPPGDTPKLNKELPLPMLLPIICMCIAILVAGLSSGWLTDNILRYVMTGGGF